MPSWDLTLRVRVGVGVEAGISGVGSDILDF